MKNIFFTYIVTTSWLLHATDLINEIRVHDNKLKVIINEDFKKTYLTDDFFVEYDSDIHLDRFDYSIQSMPFIMNVISIVWISGKTYYIDEMDAELFESLKRIKEVFKTMYPKTAWHGELIPRKLVTHALPYIRDSSKTALLFSGGIDSVSTALHHHDKQQLLITAWGHWDLPLHNKDLWNVRYEKN